MCAAADKVKQNQTRTERRPQTRDGLASGQRPVKSFSTHVLFIHNKHSDEIPHARCKPVEITAGFSNILTGNEIASKSISLPKRQRTDWESSVLVLAQSDMQMDWNAYSPLNKD